MKRALSGFMLLLGLSLPLSSYAGYDLTPEDIKAREELKKSIQIPGFWYKLGACVLATPTFVSRWVPASLNRRVDHISACSIQTLVSDPDIRRWLRDQVYSYENKIFAKYDEKFGVYSKIPEQAIEEEKLMALLEEAKEEREFWEKGVSGCNYDGSEAHLADLGRYFEKALAADDLNQKLLEGRPQVHRLAKVAFQYFNTSNPLHGTLFPLAVKSMRELGEMLASLVGGQYAIVNSGSREAIRIGIRAIKEQMIQTNPAGRPVVVAIDDESGSIRIATRSLGLKRIPSSPESFLNSDSLSDTFGPKESMIVVLSLRRSNYRFFLSILKKVRNEKLRFHLHYSNQAVRDLLIDEPILQNTVMNADSISLETEGLIYSGVTATIFADPNQRYSALESHVDWMGGIYPGINTAGSIAGVDYILAYVLLLSSGKGHLKEMAQEPAHFQEPDWRIHPSKIGRELVERFQGKLPDSSVEEFLQSYRATKRLSDTEWRQELEEALVDLSLSLFHAPSDHFTGRITSGGTESIRVALQVHIENFQKRYPGVMPRVLMAPSAHIAFDRHLADLGVQIVRVRTRALSHEMDVDHLKELLSQRHPIAAIVASAPSYPFGVADPIQKVAQIALEYGVPLHVDGCLGGYVRIDFENGEWMGVASWSADLHKYGVTQKGLSFVGFRNIILLDLELPVETICRQRSALTLEVGIACMLGIGETKYRLRAEKIARLGKDLTQKLKEEPWVEVVGEQQNSVIPDWVVAFRMKEPFRGSTYQLGAMMSALGWRLSQVGDYVLHIALTNAHTYDPEKFLDKFTSDLQYVFELIEKHPNMKTGASVGVYGMVAGLPQIQCGKETQTTLLKILMRLYAENISSQK
jgi:sphinganine-1-phosphate aldolase